MIENGGNAKSTIRISSIAAALAKDRGINLPEEEVRTRFFERLDARMDQTGPDEKLVELLKEFTNRGCRMGIVTFVRKPRILRRLDVWKLKEYFRSVITPDDVLEFKPSPRPYLGLPQGFFTGQELEKAGADRILSSLELLPTMVYK